MAVFVCKNCGADLDIQDGVSVVECQYCGTKQTVPAADNEKKMNLFMRANRQRMLCEFDKAAGIYESIIAEFPNEAEAYWGLILCKYGIEYVDDPATGKKIPTCHRSSFNSVLDDGDLVNVLANADVLSRPVYEQEASKIEALREGIVEVSSKEAPYDIFICYKETDSQGDRTLDSVLAQDIYDMLTEKGYRVFFSRISLESKLGQAYEPYIFGALHSAKIMLAIGTDPDYYTAVWVKNEWSRYLSLIAAGEKKTLIPCYKNIAIVEMPTEFARLQAQDLGKIGAMQDLLRGIEKIIGKKTMEQPAAHQQNSLLNQGKALLEEEDWREANRCFDRVLENTPGNAAAYVGKLCAERNYRRIEDLAMDRNAADKDENKTVFSYLPANVDAGQFMGLLKNGQKIKAVKLLQEKGGLSLKEAHTVCKKIVALPIEGPISQSENYRNAMYLGDSRVRDLLDALLAAAAGQNVSIPSSDFLWEQTKTENRTSRPVNVNSETISDIERHKERAYILLDDGEWKEAESEFKQILDVDLKCADGYLGMAMVEYRARKPEELHRKYVMEEKENKYLQRAIKYAQGEQLEQLRQWDQERIQKIKNRIKEERAAAERKTAEMKAATYRNAAGQMERVTTEQEFRKIAKLFESLGEYQDAPEKAILCLEKAEQAAETAYMIQKKQDDEKREKRERLEELKKLQNEKKIQEQKEKQEQEFDRQYQAAVQEVKGAVRSDALKEAILKLMKFGNYKDSIVQLQTGLERQKKLVPQNKKQKAFPWWIVLIALLVGIYPFVAVIIGGIDAIPSVLQDRDGIMRYLLINSLVTIGLAGAVGWRKGGVSSGVIHAIIYGVIEVAFVGLMKIMISSAFAEGARVIFIFGADLALMIETLVHKSSGKRQINQAGVYQNAMSAMNKGAAAETLLSAMIWLQSIRGYKDSKVQIENCTKMILTDINNRKVDIETIVPLNTQQEIRKEAFVYQEAESYFKKGNKEGYQKAMKLFQSIEGYLDAKEKVELCKKAIVAYDEGYTKSMYYMACQKLEEAASEAELLKAKEMFLSIRSYKDAEVKAAMCIGAIDRMHQQK